MLLFRISRPVAATSTSPVGRRGFSEPSGRRLKGGRCLGRELHRKLDVALAGGFGIRSLAGQGRRLANSGEQGVAAARDQAEERRLERVGLQKVGRNVPVQVVDGHERLAVRRAGDQRDRLDGQLRSDAHLCTGRGNRFGAAHHFHRARRAAWTQAARRPQGAGRCPRDRSRRALWRGRWGPASSCRRARAHPLSRRGSSPYVYSIWTRPFCFLTTTWPRSACFATRLAFSIGRRLRIVVADWAAAARHDVPAVFLARPHLDDLALRHVVLLHVLTVC